jgi:hypothetical protein
MSAGAGTTRIASSYSFTNNGGGVIQPDAGTIAIDGPVTFNAGTTIMNGSGVLVVNSANQTWAAGSAFRTNAGTTLFNAGINPAGTVANGPFVKVNVATLRLSGHSHVDGISVNTPGTIILTPGGGNTVVSRSINIDVADGGRVNLNDNRMMVDYSGPSNNSPMPTLIAYLRSGLNGGSWDGPGIDSAFAGNANSSVGLAAIEGAFYRQIYGPDASFGGEAVDDTSVLIGLTYDGDTDLNGRITFDDYTRIDTGFNTAATGYVNGDFNYDGKVDFDDYVLIDTAFNTQSGTLARAIDWISGDDRSATGLDAPGVEAVIEHFGSFGLPYARGLLAAIPEPVTVALAGLAMLGGRRTRRATGR